MALLITRSIARHLSENIVSLRYVVLVFVLSSFSILVLSSAFLDLAVIITNYIVIGDLPSLTGPGESIVTPMNYLKAILFPLYKNHSELLGGWSIGTVYGIFVWSTLMGVIWLWIFSLSVIIANLSMKLRNVGSWLDRNFKVRSQPFIILAILATSLISGPCLIYHLLKG
jgi:hypothetical protein